MGSEFDWRFVLPLAMFAYRLWVDIESHAYDRPLDPLTNLLLRPWAIGPDSARLPNRFVGSLRLAFWCVCAAGSLAAVIHPGISIPTPGWLPYMMLAALVGWFAMLSTIRVRDFYGCRVRTRMATRVYESMDREMHGAVQVRALIDVAVIVAMLWTGFVAATVGIFTHERWQA